jgi:peptidoglycan/xylan/chitin deacetylase (PgdA/CDA1 family)
MKIFWCLFFSSVGIQIMAQPTLLKFNALTEAQKPDYQALKSRLQTLFAKASPGDFGEFVKGVDEDVATNQKILALTFDACGGPHGSAYDKELIDYLKKEKIPATLFLSGLWIDMNAETVEELARDTLFEIENHGLLHRPCSADGESIYGIKGTQSAGEAIDEMELNARKIETFTHRRPLFYRSATAYQNEECVAIAQQLGFTIITFDILSGDAVAHTPAKIIQNTIVKNARPGAIVIMHFNHPDWNTHEALKVAVPKLRKAGYHFVKLEDHPLKGRGVK